MLISNDEARHTLELEDMYIIQPLHPWWKQENWKDGKPLAEGFRYASDTNSWQLSTKDVQRMMADLQVTG